MSISNTTNGSRNPPTVDYHSIGILPRAEQLAKQMADAWRCGRRIFVEEVLKTEPELASHRDVVLRLLCEEMCLRAEAGEAVSERDYIRRFPQWQSELCALAECRELFDDDGESQATKVVGELQFTVDANTPADFEIVQELGQGAQGRVYLARQHSLGGRPIVLKITDTTGVEHLSLARLQHTNIVPLYSAHDEPSQNRRILCMPYFGSLTLADLVAHLDGRAVDDRSGRDVAVALNEIRSQSALSLPEDGPARVFIAKASYVQVVCWLGACLADALHYAHERGLVHLDVKPSNILLANDGQPMLLDFHLAREPVGVGGPPPHGLGGTPLYMAPEQRAALTAVSKNQTITEPVDQRADIYALGLVLYQLLSGTPPKSSPLPRLEESNECVTPGLSDVVRKCIEDEPDKRYPNAADLALDLRRHLSDQPLKCVPNRSWRERWRKWRRRRPYTMPLVVLSMLLLVAILGGGFWFFAQQRADDRRRMTQIQRHWRIANDLFRAGRYRESADTLNTGLDAAVSLNSRAWIDAFADLLQSAKRRHALDQMHEAVEQLRVTAVQKGLAQSEKRKIDLMCGKLWSSRDRLLRLANDENAEWSARAKSDLLDVVLLWTPIRIETAGDNAKSVRRSALHDLSLAEQRFGETVALVWEKSRLTKALGAGDDLSATPFEISEASAWECVAIGRAHLQIGRTNFARTCFDRAVELRPAGFWPNYYQGVCTLRQNDYVNSLSAFRACIVAKPNSAAAFFNRALVYSRMNDEPRALKDYATVVRLDAAFGPAYLNRGVLFLKNRQWSLALADLRKALELNAEPATAYYNAALACRELGRTNEARLHLRQALQLRPQFREAKQLLRILSGPSK